MWGSCVFVSFWGLQKDAKHLAEFQWCFFVLKLFVNYKV